jgi:hypothetical protein
MEMVRQFNGKKPLYLLVETYCSTSTSYVFVISVETYTRGIVTGLRMTSVVATSGRLVSTLPTALFKAK